MSVFFARLLFLGSIITIGSIALVQTTATGQGPEYLSVRFLDVGQGDAIHIQTPDGYEMLIDGGPNSLVLRELANGRSFFDSTIDVVLATHFDSDHIGGLIDVLGRYQVATIIRTNAITDTPVSKLFTSAETAETAETARSLQAQAGQIIQLGASTTIRVLAPTGDTSQWDSNAASIIIQVSYGEIDFLLTGDAPASIEEYVATRYGSSIQSEVLKLGHHGSKTSTSELFLDAVEPDFAIVSAEKESRYGHPHKEVVDRVEERDITLLNTAQGGTIEFLTDGVTVWIQE